MATGEEVQVIHSWSAPRSLSTSLMYSFAQRDDTEVVDEPLYANFLAVTGVERPYREQVLSTMASDGNWVVKEVIFGPGEKKYRYCKFLNKNAPESSSSKQPSREQQISIASLNKVSKENRTFVHEVHAHCRHSEEHIIMYS